MNKPIATVRPILQDPRVVELNAQICLAMNIIAQRKQRQSQAVELLSRWETRSQGRVTMSEVQILNREVKVVLDEIEVKLAQYDADFNQRSLEEFRAHHRRLLEIQDRDQADEREGLIYINNNSYVRL